MHVLTDIFKEVSQKLEEEVMEADNGDHQQVMFMH